MAYSLNNEDIQAEIREATLQQNKRDEINMLKEKNRERSKGPRSTFSGAQKKKQLRERKARINKRRENEAKIMDSSKSYQDFFNDKENFSDNDIDGINLSQLSISNNLKLVTSLGRSRDNIDRQLSSFFVKETKEQIQLRIMEGRIPIDMSKREFPLRSTEIFRDRVLDHIRRPMWSCNSTKKSVEDKESIAFNNWLADIHDKYDHDSINHFEHNLEVWRELWRLLERSTHIVLVADIRNPLLHIPPSLYEQVTKNLKKPMTIVLNKVDLVPRDIVKLWIEYLQKQFPGCVFVPFSSRNIDINETTDMRIRRKVLSNRLTVGDFSAMRSARNVLQSCGIDAEYAKSIIEAVNADDIGKEKDTISKKSRRRRAKRDVENSEILEQADIEVEVCGYCGVDGECVVSCSGCFDGEDILLCKRCDLELHIEEGKLHARHYINSNNEISSSQIDSKNTSKSEPEVIIGLVGHPNVGKSSVLNALAGKKIVSVSHTPGHTKRLQTIMIDMNVCVCDCPGLVFPFTKVPRYLQELCGLYPYSQTREPFSAVRFLAEHLEIEKLLALEPRKLEFDGVMEDMEWTAWSICEAFAEKRGYRTDRRGRPDHNRAGLELIRDCIDGIIPLFFYPPDYDGEICVTSHKEFNDAQRNSPTPLVTKSNIEDDGNEEISEESSSESEIDTTGQNKNGFGLLDSSDGSE